MTAEEIEKKKGKKSNKMEKESKGEQIERKKVVDNDRFSF